MKKFLIIILFLLLGLFWLKILYIVPYSNYTITDQTGKVKLKDCPELKEISFMYSTDLYMEYTEPINLELEKINFRFNDEVIGTAEIRKKCVLQKEFLRILGRNAKVYDSLEDGRFYIDIYIKDLKTNETFIIKRDNISIYYQSAGLKLFLPSV